VYLCVYLSSFLRLYLSVSNWIYLSLLCCSAKSINARLSAVWCRHCGKQPDRQTDICVAYYIDCDILLNPSSHGRRPSADWGDGPPKKLRWGDGSCIRPPNILRSSFVGCARKHEQSEKSCNQWIIFLNRGFSREERVMYGMTLWKETRKIRKSWSMTKKGHQKFWTWKWRFVPKRTSFRNLGLQNFFPVPGLRLCVFLLSTDGVTCHWSSL